MASLFLCACVSHARPDIHRPDPPDPTISVEPSPSQPGVASLLSSKSFFPTRRKASEKREERKRLARFHSPLDPQAWPLAWHKKHLRNLTKRGRLLSGVLSSPGGEREMGEGRLQGCCQRAPRCPRGTQGQGEYAAERQMHFQWAGCLLPTGQPCLFGRTKSPVWLQRRKGTCWEDTLIPLCSDRTLNSLDLVH